ncbi:hypothetical protein PG994_006064 [Apiospora phragmitis]|uniref:Uncharacterized protein n=1 Tax=Apiospora phragmitis TaxID=2905665 RepID=A0ABR1VE00_9PEZI
MVSLFLLSSLRFERKKTPSLRTSSDKINKRFVLEPFLSYDGPRIDPNRAEVNTILKVEHRYVVSEMEKECFQLAEDRGVVVTNFALNKTFYDMEYLLKSRGLAPCHIYWLAADCGDVVHLRALEAVELLSSIQYGGLKLGADHFSKSARMELSYQNLMHPSILRAGGSHSTIAIHQRDTPPNSDLATDTRTVRSYVQSLIEAGRSVIAMLHSYGGQVGTNALIGLGLEARAKEGLKGGVSYLIYMCAFAML